MGKCIWLIFIGFAFNFFETWYFGWNSKPSCPAEMICDYIASGLMYSGTLGIVYLCYNK